MKNGSKIGVFVVVLMLSIFIYNREEDASEEVGVASRLNDSVEIDAVQMGHNKPVVLDPRLGRLVDRNAADRVSDDMPTRFKKVLYEEDIPSLVYVLRDPSDDDNVRHEVANLLRRSNYSGLTEDLLFVLENPLEKERFRNFVIQHLYLGYEKGSIDERSEIKTTLKKSLNDQHVSVRREALLSLGRMDDPIAIKTAVLWLDDDDHNDVHDLAIRVMREGGNRGSITKIRTFIHNPVNESACVSAIVTLGEWRDSVSIESLRELQNNGSPRVQRACSLALKRISGELKVSQSH